MQLDPKKPRYTTRELGDALGVSPRTVESWRLEGRGPRGLRLGRRVVYTRTDVQEWLDRQPRVGECAEEGAGA